VDLLHPFAVTTGPNSSLPIHYVSLLLFLVVVGLACIHITVHHLSTPDVSDLHPEVAERDLIEKFSELGPVSSVRLCRDRTTRLSLGHGYVNYERTEDAERAIMVFDFTELKGKVLRVQWSHRDSAVRENPRGNLFVRNLPRSVDDKRLHDGFSHFGNIPRSKVYFSYADSPVGYGLLSFENEEDAQKAMEAADNGEVIIDGEPVSVEPAKSKEERDREEAAIFTNVYVKNVPLSWDKQQFDDFFSHFGTITGSQITFDEEMSRDCGIGFVNFETHEQAMAAIEGATGHIVGEGEDAKTLYACRALKKAERERARQEKWQGCNLYVKHLPKNMTIDRLSSLFSPFGVITSVQLTRSAGGTNTGVAHVCFETPEEAATAIAEMNGVIVDDKTIFVTLHQIKETREQTRPRSRYNGSQRQRQHYMHQYNGNTHHSRYLQAPHQHMHGQPPALQQYMSTQPTYMQPTSMQPLQTQPINAMQPLQHGMNPTQHVMYPTHHDTPNNTAYPRHPHGPRPASNHVARPPVRHQDVRHQEEVHLYPTDPQKQILWQALYPHIAQCLPEHSRKAAQVTALLLEMEPVDVLAIIADETACAAKVVEAVISLAESTEE